MSHPQQPQTFALDQPYIPLCNLLKVCGIAETGGAAKLMVAEGLVQVDGQQELRKACKIRAGQRISGVGFSGREFVIEVVAGEA